MPGRARNNGRLALLVTTTVCALVACSTPPPSSPAQRAADAATTARVQAALAAAPNLFSRDIVVSVQDGVVNLSGMAWSDDDIQTAGRVAGSVPGVKRVDNQVGLESAEVGR
jgi:osmotically-inducible protein OsmY